MKKIIIFFCISISIGVCAMDGPKLDRYMTVYCPNNLRAAVIDKFGLELKIFSENKAILLQQRIDEIPQFFALSPITCSIAFIRAMPRNFLVVKNFSLDREHFFELNNPDFVPYELSYNSEGTDITVYGLINGKPYLRPFSLHHKICFPFQEDI